MGSFNKFKMDKCLICTKKTRAAMKYKPREL